jgi:hypothetical protein
MYNTQFVFSLPGVNVPDHEALFETLSSDLHDRVTPYVATLQTRHCATVRSAIEHMVLQFMNYNKFHHVSSVMCDAYE